MGPSKAKKGVFPGLCNKSLEIRGLHKKILEGGPETSSFGFIQLFDLSLPGGPATHVKIHKRGMFPG